MSGSGPPLAASCMRARMPGRAQPRARARHRIELPQRRLGHLAENWFRWYERRGETDTDRVGAQTLVIEIEPRG